MDSDFCVDALEEAMARYGIPEIFNADQRAQFASDAFTDVLKAAVQNLGSISHHRYD